MMDALIPVVKSHPYISVLVSSLLFRVVHKLLQWLPVPKVVRQNELRAWKWRNLSVSMVHSLLTGTWALACAYTWPELFGNIHSFFTPSCYLLIVVSTGYFVQDAGDIILTGHALGSWEFLIHHALVIWSFLYALNTQIYVGGAVIALFVEVNSVTLHLRLMLKLANQQSSTVFLTNKYLNIMTYVPARLVTQSFLTWTLYKNYDWMDHSGCFMMCLIAMDGMILIYFYRLLRADFFRRGKGHANGVHNNNSEKFLTD